MGRPGLCQFPARGAKTDPGESAPEYAAYGAPLTGAISENVALASIGRCPEADFVANSWWTAEQPEMEMGRVAAQHLLHHLDEKEPAPHSLVLPVDWHHNRQ